MTQMLGDNALLTSLNFSHTDEKKLNSAHISRNIETITFRINIKLLLFLINN